MKTAWGYCPREGLTFVHMASKDNQRIQEFWTQTVNALQIIHQLIFDLLTRMGNKIQNQLTKRPDFLIFEEFHRQFEPASPIIFSHILFMGVTAILEHGCIQCEEQSTLPSIHPRKPSGVTFLSTRWIQSIRNSQPQTFYEEAAWRCQRYEASKSCDKTKLRN